MSQVEIEQLNIRIGKLEKSLELVASRLMTLDQLLKDQVSKGDSRIKSHKAAIRIDGMIVHIGYYKSIEERDQAVALAKIGIYPEGFEMRLAGMRARRDAKQG